MVLFKIWLISLSLLFIFGLLKLSEKEQKDWTARKKTDLSGIIVGTMMDLFPLWVIRLAGALIGIMIMIGSLYFI